MKRLVRRGALPLKDPPLAGASSFETALRGLRLDKGPRRTSCSRSGAARRSSKRGCRRRLSAVEAGQRRLRQHVRIRVEANRCGRSVLIDIELVDAERKDGNHVVMRLTRRRAWAAIGVRAEVGDRKS